MERNQIIREINRLFSEYKLARELIEQTVILMRLTRAMSISIENKNEILRVENELLQFSTALKHDLMNKLRDFTARL